MKTKYSFEMKESSTLNEFEDLVKKHNITRSFAIQQAMTLWVEEQKRKEKNK